MLATRSDSTVSTPELYEHAAFNHFATAWPVHRKCALSRNTDEDDNGVESVSPRGRATAPYQGVCDCESGNAELPFRASRGTSPPTGRSRWPPTCEPDRGVRHRFVDLTGQRTTKPAANEPTQRRRGCWGRSAWAAHIGIVNPAVMDRKGLWTRFRKAVRSPARPRPDPCARCGSSAARAPFRSVWRSTAVRPTARCRATRTPPSPTRR